MRSLTCATILVALFAAGQPATAQQPAQAELKQLRADIERLQNRIADLEAQLKKMEATERSTLPAGTGGFRPFAGASGFGGEGFGPSGGFMPFGGGGGFGFAPLGSARTSEVKEIAERYQKLRADAEKHGIKLPPAPAVFAGTIDPRQIPAEMRERLEKMRAEVEKSGGRFPPGFGGGAGPRDPKQMREMIERFEKGRTGNEPKDAGRKDGDKKEAEKKEGERPAVRGAGSNTPFGPPRDFGRGARGDRSGPWADFGRRSGNADQNAKVDQLIERIIKDLEQLRQEMKR